jgi:hypothetical protein
MIEGACLCGGVKFRFEATPEGATACSCTACRRYGTLWIYDYEGEGVFVEGTTTAYSRGEGVLGFHFCPTCGCVAYWRATEANAEGRWRLAVNVRLCDPEVVAHIPIDRFDGFDKWEDLPRDGRCVRDYWF